MKKDDLRYAHNPGYCMIRPDEDEDVVSTGQS